MGSLTLVAFRKIPPMPKWLDREARAEWRRVTALMLELGTITLLDGPLVAGHCLMFSEIQMARRVLARAARTARQVGDGLSSLSQVAR